MPVFLPLDSTCNSNPNHVHLAIIESWMLWPDNEQMRGEALASAGAVHGQRLSRQKPLPAPIIEYFLDLAVDAKPQGQLRELAKDPYRQGRLAGEILYLTIEGRVSMEQSPV